jgi:glycosyltransferase involved in cell wall biosynthesis
MDNLVSVIIPMYNAEIYIEQTVESVINQTYENIEIIIVNDGSKDLSELKVNRLIERFSNLVYLKKENTGVSDTRNIGIAKAKGDFIAFLDADDIWLPTNVEKKIFELEKTKKDWVFSDHLNIDESNNNLQKDPHVYRSTNVVEDLLLWDFSVVPGPCSNIIVRANLFKKNILFDKKLSSPADRDICLQLGMESEPAFIAEPLWLYRIHSQSMTAVNSKVIDEMIYLNKKAIDLGWYQKSKFKKKSISNIYFILAGISKVFPIHRKRMVGFLFKSFYNSPINFIKKVLKKIT